MGKVRDKADVWREFRRQFNGSRLTRHMNSPRNLN